MCRLLSRIGLLPAAAPTSSSKGDNKAADDRIATTVSGVVHAAAAANAGAVPLPLLLLYMLR